MRGLLIIDVQQGLIDFDRASWVGVLDNIARLLSKAREASAPVVFVQHNEERGLRPGTPAWQIPDAISPQPGEAIVQKRWSDAFTDTELESVLRGAGIDTIVAAGAQSDYCVDATVRRAASLGFNVILASDAHTTSGNGVLTREQIVAHHNVTLSRLALDGPSITTLPSAEISFVAVPQPGVPS
jgi:nicotinamidase-related amidase